MNDINTTDRVLFFVFSTSPKPALIPTMAICSICLNGVGGRFKHTTVSKTACGHTFHTKCMIECADNGITNCPNCRTSIVTDFKKWGLIRAVAEPSIDHELVVVSESTVERLKTVWEEAHFLQFDPQYVRQCKAMYVTALEELTRMRESS